MYFTKDLLFSREFGQGRKENRALSARNTRVSAWFLWPREKGPNTWQPENRRGDVFGLFGGVPPGRVRCRCEDRFGRYCERLLFCPTNKGRLVWVRLAVIPDVRVSLGG